MTKNDSKYYFDENAAEAPIQWIETYCTYTDGKMMGEPLRLADFQKEILREAFGWKQKENDYRKYSTVYVELPRGNGKSTFGTAVSLYLLVGDGEGAAELYACAGSRDQAGKLFGPAKIMVQNSDELSSILSVQRSAILDYETHSAYKVVSADGKLQHGHKPHGVFFDELHVQPNDELWEAFVTAMTKRDQPMLWTFTTAGVSGTFAEEIHDYAVKVKSGVLEDDTFLPIIFAAEKSETEEDYFSEEVWKAANPAWAFMNHREFEKAANMARSSERMRYSFLRLHLNIWTSSAVSWMPIEAWDKGNKYPVTLENFKGKSVFCALDMASVRDLCSFCIFEPESGDTYWMHFCPEAQIHQRSSHNITYNKWLDGGWITPVSGNTVSASFVLGKILTAIKDLNVEVINFDRKFASDVVNGLIEEGYDDEIVKPFGQGFLSMNAPMKELEKYILDGNINHGGNPLMRWQLTNVVAMEDDAENIKPSKKKSKDKIDGVVSLIMAIGGYMNWKADNVKHKKKTRKANQILG